MNHHPAVPGFLAPTVPVLNLYGYLAVGGVATFSAAGDRIGGRVL